MSIVLLADVGPVNPPMVGGDGGPVIGGVGVVEDEQLDQIVHDQFEGLVPVGVAVVEVGGVKCALVSTSGPTVSI